MQLTIVLPTYNEVDNLSNIVVSLFGLSLTNLKVIIIDDNSPDGTGEIADDLADHFGDKVSVIHRSGKLGLGTAYIHGFKLALQEGAEAVGQMDADFSHPPEKLPEMLKALESCDVVIGSRYVPGGSVDESWPLWRKGLSSFGNLYARSILNLTVHDTTSGFRLWHNQALIKMPLDKVRSNGYAFQVEMTYVAQRLGFKFQEIPIYFADRRWGYSKMSFQIQLEAAIRVWQLIWIYRNFALSSE